MARIRRAHLERGFTTLSNDIIQSKALTFRAKGLLMYLLSLPDTFVLRVNCLIDRSLEGKHIIYETLTELKHNGLLDRVQYRDDRGKISGWDYVIYDAVQPELLNKFGAKNLLSKDQEVEQDGIKNELFPDFLDEEVLAPEDPPLNNKYRINKYNNKKAAAIEISESSTAPQIAAADFSVTTNEKITDELTTMQQQQVWQVAKEYSKQYRQQLGNKNAQSLYHDICHDLKNPKSWTLCGNDFLKKLNVIKKHIRQGKWIASAALVKDSTSKESATSKPVYTAEVSTLAVRYEGLLKSAEICYYVLTGTLCEFDKRLRNLEEAKMQTLLEEILSVQGDLKVQNALVLVEENLPSNLKIFIPREEQLMIQEKKSC